MKTLGLAMQRIGAAVNKGLWGGLLACLMVFQGAAYGAERVVYYHHDALGSPVAATDEQGAVIWREEYQPYGERLLRQDGGTNRLWFTGKPEEERLGLSYFGARWYDPTIGQFLGVDPVSPQEGNPHSFNRYAYANNNPYKFVDPDGNSPLDVGFFIADSIRFTLAVYSGNPQAIASTGFDLAASALGLASPVPGMGQAIKAARAADKAANVLTTADKVGDVAKGTLPSAGGVVRQFEQAGDKVYYRVFSGDANVGGWLTAVPPRSSAWAQEALALPPGNKATMGHGHRLVHRG